MSKSFTPVPESPDFAKCFAAGPVLLYLDPHKDKAELLLAWQRVQALVEEYLKSR